MDKNKKEDIAVFENVDIIGEVNTKVLDLYFKKERKSLDEILEEVTQDKKFFDEIKLGSRRRHLSEFKKRFIQISVP